MSTENVKNIIKDIETKIDQVGVDSSVEHIGKVTYVGDGVAKISGLTGVAYNEIIDFDNGEKGVALDLEENSVWVIILGDYLKVKEGSVAKSTGEVLSIPVGEAFQGRIVDSLARPLDGKGAIASATTLPIEKVAPGVITRKSVDQPLQTGIKAIDGLIPIGKGQRELIIGDRQTGKTSIAIDTIINQKGQDMVCVYVSIGQKDSKMAKIVEELDKKGAMDYTIVVAANSSSPAAMQYLAPYAGVTLAEYFMDQGKDVLVVYDDLSKQAVAYREISLLLRRPPGREAFPGDVFYLHSRLLERAARLDQKYGGGSITGLPIIETQEGDLSAYIPTNVISITDGQIFLDSNLFNSGNKPAIDVGNSVSRVWGSAQTKAMKKVAGKLKLELAVFRELAAFSQFASDLDAETKAKLKRGEMLTEILKQNVYSPISFEKQVCLFYAAINNFLADIALDKLTQFEQDLYDKLDAESTILSMIVEKKELTDEIKASLDKLIQELVDSF